MVNITEEGEFRAIAQIFLNIPTPFEKGDLLVATSKTPFPEGYILDYERFPFVLEYLINWDNSFERLLAKGNFDSSDMQGPGYFVADSGKVYCDNVFDYDKWEYFKGELKGEERILKAISSLEKDEIGIDLFLSAFEEIKKENIETNIGFFTDRGLQLAGFSNEDIKKFRNEYWEV